MWGHTDVGDYCFLRPDGTGARRICVWYQEGEWHESDLTFSQWLLRELRGIDGDRNILKFRDGPTALCATRIGGSRPWSRRVDVDGSAVGVCK